MSLSTERCLAAIETYSAMLADAARGNLDADVEHCPGWSVADLMSHVTDVHWFWAVIVQERLSAPPEETRRPARASDDRLVETFQMAARRLVDVLSTADQSAACWTWAPSQQHVAFVTRHQVQEVAVHAWDAVHATGGFLDIAPDVAQDAIEEFLSVSVSSDADPADPPRPALDGGFVLRSTDVGTAWTVRDGSSPGTVRYGAGGDRVAAAVAATASQLLLWLYRRVPVDTAAVPSELIARFRGLCYTD